MRRFLIWVLAYLFFHLIFLFIAVGIGVQFSIVGDYGLSGFIASLAMIIGAYMLANRFVLLVEKDKHEDPRD